MRLTIRIGIAVGVTILAAACGSYAGPVSSDVEAQHVRGIEQPSSIPQSVNSDAVSDSVGAGNQGGDGRTIGTIGSGG